MRTADVCLILEGTYPYVKGGVAEWAHQLIRGLPHLTFHLWCLIPDQSLRKMSYPLAENVTGVTDICLFEDPLGGSPEPLPEALWDRFQGFHDTHASLTERAHRFWDTILPLLPAGKALPVEELLFSDRAYERVLSFYQSRSPNLPFLEYFYTYVFSHYPLYKLLGAPVPPARLYHAIATGFAGLAGCRARQATGRPLLLTEHGIYTNERQVEIILADWVYSRPKRGIHIGPSRDTLKNVWTQLFELLGRLTYNEANRITTLFGGNLDMQVQLGADPQKIDVIANGVDRVRFSPDRRTDPESPLVVLVGRVVAIKDVRTFIRACRAVADRNPRARFAVLGPTDQEPEYFEKCMNYRHLLGLDDRLEFTGAVKVTEWYPRMDVFVLTSVSEGLPLTVLEAMASGVPVVCTRVGACEELVEGREPADRDLGRAGFVTSVGDHLALGSAIAALLKDRNLSERCARAGLARVERYYDERTILDQYQKLYSQWLQEAR